MEQRFVTFKVAKALKEAGYWNPGTIIKCSYNNSCYIDDGRFYKDGCVCPWDRLYPAPTYIETWLWLWREKKNEIDIQVLSRRGGGGRVRVFPDYFKLSKVFELNDPEEAIAKAIDYLVENNLIK